MKASTTNVSVSVFLTYESTANVLVNVSRRYESIVNASVVALCMNSVSYTHLTPPSAPYV